MPAVAEEERMRPPIQTQSIMIVDDNENVTRALASILQEEGYQTAIFHSGSDALAYAERATPSAAVIDIHLPDINGLILSHKLRDHLGPRTPIIVLSGDASMEVLKSLSHVGATCFYRKPVNSTALLEQLRELMA